MTQLPTLWPSYATQAILLLGGEEVIWVVGPFGGLLHLGMGLLAAALQVRWDAVPQALVLRTQAPRVQCEEEQSTVLVVQHRLLHLQLPNHQLPLIDDRRLQPWMTLILKDVDHLTYMLLQTMPLEHIHHPHRALFRPVFPLSRTLHSHDLRNKWPLPLSLSKISYEASDRRSLVSDPVG